MNKWNSAYLCIPQKQVSLPGYLVVLAWDNKMSCETRIDKWTHNK